jgi:hypothetical protein
MNASYVDHLTALYLAAFTALGIHPLPDDMCIQDDFSCDLRRADHYILQRIEPDEGMTVNCYRPGFLNVTLDSATDYLNAVLPTASQEFRTATFDRRAADVEHACNHWFPPMRLTDLS